MIWLTWRQFRLQAWVGVALVAVVAGALLVTAPRMFDLYDLSAYAACTTSCGEAAETFLAEMERAWLVPVYLGATAAVYLLPALIGVFWGAPLVSRELESGTHRLVWSQSVGRGRWITVKLIGVGLAVVLVAGLISLALTWWAEPTDAATGGRIGPLLFSARGVVPLGYAAFAFVAGVLIGLLTRRTVLAMAVTLLLVALVQVAVPMGLRQFYSSPVHTTTAWDAERIDTLGIHPDNTITVTLDPPVEGVWVLSNATVDASGAEFTGPVDPTKCGREGTFEQCNTYLGSLGLRQDITYVPAERFWTMQWRELGLLGVVTALLAFAAVWWVRRRVT